MSIRGPEWRWRIGDTRLVGINDGGGGGRGLVSIISSGLGLISRINCGLGLGDGGPGCHPSIQCGGLVEMSSTTDWRWMHRDGVSTSNTNRERGSCMYLMYST